MSKLIFENSAPHRLEALGRQQQQQQHQHPGSSRGAQGTDRGARSRPATIQAASAAATTTDEEAVPPTFPYVPLSASSQPTSHIASRLQLPAAAACQGNVEDILKDLMQPHMPLPVAQTMIATRTAADKAVILINPTGRINLARASSSSRGRQQRLSSKLLPRAQRVQLSALPKSGIDYAAMLSLHDLWARYAGGVLSGAQTAEAFERFLNTLDWHGALVRVVACRNPIYLHRAGVVAKATHSTFELVSDDGRSSTVPLKGSSFECSVDCGRTVHVVLSGDNLKALKCVEKVE